MIEELINKATKHGAHIGQTALAEFILKEYANEISPKLTRLLEALNHNAYDVIARNSGRPAEDIALEVSKILDKTR